MEQGPALTEITLYLSVLGNSCVLMAIMRVQVQQKSQEVAEAHGRNKDIEADLRLQASNIATKQADLADTLR